MGELDEKAFQNACRKKYKAEEADIKAAELCSSWQEELKKPAWHPFKIVTSDGKEQVTLLITVFLFLAMFKFYICIYFLSHILYIQLLEFI